jgi:hypothetical protein
MTGDAMHAWGPWPGGEDPVRCEYYDDLDAPVPNSLVVATSAVGAWAYAALLSAYVFPRGASRHHHYANRNRCPVW